ncbi:TIM-barrel domain-containing protein [Dysgonomonas macrotermitis]|uniref:Alpha-D-xyloside xylohydrolase n=1 Tax=Dysgonomonas macrotermitis TaxID=1346286 RepID=A0A1M5B0I8_9BACT|nr:TIM-barrel domain-containing protein [Dysgonomonas macrotermitis]SHF35960.1 alpha-D-xyloside xylohydrolase [Dysgonomonas macrotermitis]
MKKHLFLVALLVPALFFSCKSSSYTKTEDGVIVSLKEQANSAKSVRLQVINDDVIRVTATPTGKFSDKKSLITVFESTQKQGWDVVEKDSTVSIKTATTIATVSLTTGEVVFTDLNGNVLLSENKGGGKSFTDIEVEGKKAYTFRQVFESPDDEAFYGLGQHQADEFNYKGKNEILFQYNTKVSVPFVISSKNYGILWDNYSLTKFGDPNDYQDLNQFRLYDKNGKEGSLTATYLVNGDPKQVFVERSENKIDYENLETVENFPKDFPFNNSRITWEGELEAKESGIHRFILYYAGYTKVYINDEEVVAERWRTAWNPNSYKFTYNFEAGKKYKVKVDWKPDGGISYVSLKFLNPRADQDQNKLSLWSEMGDEIDYYFIRGNNMDDVIKGYRTVTGKSQVMPKWAMGFWQSRERYKTQDELLGALKEYRKRNIPIDNIVLDWSYWPQNAWGSHDFDQARFPDAKGMIDSIHAMDARIMISVWPKFYYTTDNYKAFDKEGWMFNRAVKDSIRDWIGTGYIAGFYDAYSEGARKMFWNQMSEKLYSKGIDAWWMDASEPDILSNASMQYRKELMTPTALGPSTEYFNAYALVNAQGIYEGQRSEKPNDRVFLLTRSGFAGLQRYSTATWSGDIGTRWEDMKSQISAGLNFAMSGIPYWTMDIGGFCVEKRYETAKEGSEDLKEWRELNTRWFQFGAFCPLFRSHGQYPYREIYNIAPEGHPAYNSMVYYTKLRYRLMPYIYSLAGMTYFNDYTIMRAMVMDFTADQKTHNISDQYMFGPDLMVCPVYKYKSTSRNVYFPENSNWYDFETKAYITGGKDQVVSAPYEKIPLFVREGAILPMGKDIQNTKQVQEDIVLQVYTGKDGEFTLYEDEGVNYNYEKGKYSTIKISYDEKTKTITIGDIQGEYDGMPKSRKIDIEWFSKDGQKRPVTSVTYTGKQLTVNM